jgi:RND family efflux transporter MFP subunit
MPHIHATAVTATAIALALLLTGCGQPPAPTVQAPRPVKIEVVGDSAADAREAFVGTLRARQRSDLGFESPGRIAAILVEVGDHVRAGQVLARLEEAPARWRLDKAEADRDAAAAALGERTTLLQRHEALAKDHMVSATMLHSVQVQHRQAVSQLQAADAALALARRDLALARITAPFDGEIVARSAQPHTDVGAGQPVLQIEAGRALDVVAMLPDTVAARLSPGAAASASSQGRKETPLKLERLSARSDSGSLVQAIFRVDGPAEGLRSGGVVSVELPRASAAAISVPASAVVYGGDARRHASVFVLDATKQHVSRRAVVLGDTILPGGRVAVTMGLVRGDQVVVAGTAFLTEGQRAVKHDAHTLLDGGRS